jgi:hypothetical protein
MNRSAKDAVPNLIRLGECVAENKQNRLGWAYFLGWAMVIFPGAFSLEYWEVYHNNGWVVACYARDYWTAFFGAVALVLAVINHRDWMVWSYGLGAAAIGMIGVGFNVGDVLCPEYVGPVRGAPIMPYY